MYKLTYYSPIVYFQFQGTFVLNQFGILIRKVCPRRQGVTSFCKNVIFLNCYQHRLPTPQAVAILGQFFPVCRLTVYRERAEENRPIEKEGGRGREQEREREKLKYCFFSHL